MGLIITRKIGESFTICNTMTGEEIVITLKKGSGRQYRVNIEASMRYTVRRNEKKKEEKP